MVLTCNETSCINTIVILVQFYILYIKSESNRFYHMILYALGWVRFSFYFRIIFYASTKQDPKELIIYYEMPFIFQYYTNIRQEKESPVV